MKNLVETSQYVSNIIINGNEKLTWNVTYVTNVCGILPFEDLKKSNFGNFMSDVFQFLPNVCSR